MRGSVGEHGSLISFRTGSTPATATNFVNVYSYLDHDGSDLDFKLIPLWEESWRQQGWTPRLLTIRDAKKHEAHKIYPGIGVVATAVVGGGWFSRIDLINVSFKPFRPRRRVEVWPGIGIWWGTKRGLNEAIKSFPSHCSAIRIHSEPIESLISVQGMETIEQIEQCLAARKKS